MTRNAKEKWLTRRRATAARMTEEELNEMLERNKAEYNSFKAEKKRAKYDSENEPCYNQRAKAAEQVKFCASMMEHCKLWINVCLEELANREADGVAFSDELWRSL